MKALFCKQARLVAHPMTYIFPLLGCMLLIPSYPYTVAFFYTTLGIFFMFQNGREARDADYSALLPIRKRDTVLTAILFSAAVELFSLLFALPFAILSAKWNAAGNPAGINPNPVLFALGFLLYAVFNGIFFPAFYRSGYKLGIAFLKAGTGVFFIVACDVILPHLPNLSWLDDRACLRQLPLLGIAILLYLGITFFACRRSMRLYENVD